jgi:pyruvate/2-oxoglutarate dehydrogenase complex dihydrolipoamide acyltransferase (E2) component
MTFQETGVKFIVLATALLAPTLAFAQGAAPTPAPAQAQAPAAAPAPRPAKQPAAPKKAAQAAQAQAGIEMLEVSQVLGLRQIDPATYEIGIRLQNGKEVHLRANAFVLQSLGQLLGTYGQAR